MCRFAHSTFPLHFSLLAFPFQHSVPYNTMHGILAGGRHHSETYSSPADRLVRPDAVPMSAAAAAVRTVPAVDETLIKITTDPIGKQRVRSAQ